MGLADAGQFGGDPVDLFHRMGREGALLGGRVGSGILAGEASLTDRGVGQRDDAQPAAGLDPRARIELREMIGRLAADGKSVLISSHILTELADCCTSIGIVERGKLLMHGPIEEVYRRIQRNRIVVIKFLENMEAGVSILRSFPETRDVQIDGSRVTVELAADENTTAQVLERLLAGGVRLQSFAEKEPTLEDVFMLVTKGAVA